MGITPIVALLLFFAMITKITTASQSIGICYGMIGDNLPAQVDVISLYKDMNVTRMRLYNPNPDALQALKGSGITVMVGVPNENLQTFASDLSAAANWVATNIKAYYPDVTFSYINVGNEVIPGDEAQFVLPAMQHIQLALNSAGLNQIKVSTSISMVTLGKSYPPSAGAFSDEAQAILAPIVQFLSTTGAPLLANIYPYFAYVGNMDNISLAYALFTSPETVVKDGNSQLSYQNLFDAMVDSLYAALEKACGAQVKVVVSETGWPTAGGEAATVHNAYSYNQNLVRHVKNGTPRRPGELETYIFAMFNENQKQPQGVENNWGLYYPSKKPLYQIQF